MYNDKFLKREVSTTNLVIRLFIKNNQYKEKQMKTTSVPVVMGGYTWKAAASIACGLVVLGIVALGLPQLITGTLVNAVLFTMAEYVGIEYAVTLGIFTPLCAMISGVLPLPLLAMAPVIALSNAVLVVSYGLLKRFSVFGLVVPAILKFSFLYAVTFVLLKNPPQLSVAGQAQMLALPQSFISMLRWPQLVTALAGGLLFFIYKNTSNRFHK
jgi:hypothetical protein